jgi:uncharacterized protein YecE (DUF72 family)
MERIRRADARDHVEQDLVEAPTPEADGDHGMPIGSAADRAHRVSPTRGATERRGDQSGRPRRNGQGLSRSGELHGGRKHGRRIARTSDSFASTSSGHGWPMLAIGTCGWDYRHWRGGLYPPRLRRQDWLAWYANAFGAVEVDATFYGLPSEHAVHTWSERTPEDFRMTIKASRYLTHVRHLHEPEEPLTRIYSRLALLGPRLGPLLVQLPPTKLIDLGSLGELLRVAERWNWSVAVEPRHPSWFTDAFSALLAHHNATAVWTDWWGHVSPHTRTADWGYVRLHAGGAHPEGAYSEHALHSWVERIATQYDDATMTYVMFNNDAHGCAPRNAARLAELARHAALATARAPQAGLIPLIA